MSSGLTLEEAATAIARAEWEDLPNRMLSWAEVSDTAKGVLIGAAHKGICVGMVLAGMPARAEVSA